MSCNCASVMECNKREGCFVKEALGPEANDFTVVHMSPDPGMCDHDFQGWRKFKDGRGGERVCAKCGLGAMAHTLSLDF